MPKLNFIAPLLLSVALLIPADYSLADTAVISVDRAVGERSEVIDLHSAGLAVGDTLRIRDESGGLFTVEISRAHYSQSGNLLLSGRVLGGGSLVLVASSEGFVEGSLSSDGESYRLHSDGYTTITLTPVDRSNAIPIDDGIASTDTDPTAQAADQAGIREGVRSGMRRLAHRNNRLSISSITDEAVFPVYEPRSVVDILIYYDNSMTDPIGIAEFVVEYANWIFERNQTGLQVRIAELVSVPISDNLTNRQVFDLLEGKQAPFSDFDTDRSRARADLVHVLRDSNPSSSNNCGLGRFSVWAGYGYRDDVYGVTQWQPDTGGSYCLDLTFTHEIGHNLGLAHARSEHDELIVASYDYSYATLSAGVFQTVMAGGFYDEQSEALSAPETTCFGVPCGVSPAKSNSADNRRATMNAMRLVAAYEGAGYDYASLQEYGVDSSCSDGTPFRGVRIRNNSQYDLEVVYRTFLRADGSPYFEGGPDAGELTIASGDSRGRGFCGNGEDQPIGSEVREAVFHYRNPETGEVFEGTHIYFDDDYTGEYATVRAAAAEGGSVVGNPSLYSRVDDSVRITFEPNYGYKLSDVSGTCSGTLRNNVYTAEPIYGDCWAVGEFRELTGAERAQQHFTNLLDSIMAVRGR